MIFDNVECENSYHTDLIILKRILKPTTLIARNNTQHIFIKLRSLITVYETAKSSAYCIRTATINQGQVEAILEKCIAIEILNNTFMKHFTNLPATW